MNPEQLQQSQTSQLEDYLTPNMSGIADHLELAIFYGTIASIAILIPFLILYIISSRRKSKSYKAIIDIQKTLHEMNERDKARDLNRNPAPSELIASVPTSTQSHQS